MEISEFLLLQWSHGRLTVVTPFLGWISAQISRLQWSHGRLTVVTWLEFPYFPSLYIASMEPRSFNRGDMR